MYLKQSTFSLASSQRLTSTCLQPRPCMEMISTHKGHWKSQQELWEVFVCPHCLPLLFESNEEVRRIRVSSNAANKTEKDKRPPEALLATCIRARKSLEDSKLLPMHEKEK